VEITKPLENSFYLHNSHLFSIPGKTIIFGPIDVTVDVNTDSEMEKVEFYIDGKLKKTVTEDPFTFRWRPFKLFKHTIKVVAYNKDGNYAEDEIKVW